MRTKAEPIQGALEQPTAPPLRVLVLSDYDRLRATLERCLWNTEHAIAVAEFSNAPALLSSAEFDCVLVDSLHQDAHAILDFLRAHSPMVKRVLLSNRFDRADVAKAVRTGLAHVVLKLPLRERDLAAALAPATSSSD
jgi:DNA-binding NarL/FixJ family response regulator